MNKIVILDISFEYGDETKTINPIILISKKDVVLVDCGYSNFLSFLVYILFIFLLPYFI